MLGYDTGLRLLFFFSLKGAEKESPTLCVDNEIFSMYIGIGNGEKKTHDSIQDVEIYDRILLKEEDL